jgi:hypothetical protein
MSIVIRRVGEQYEAIVRPPHADVAWNSEEPLAADDLIEVLLGLGCHQTDIGDAFYDADPEWLLRDRHFAEDE